MILGGFFEAVITPPVGSQIPGMFFKRASEGVHDDLFAKALVLDNGMRKVGLVTVDALSLKRSTVAAARQEASRLTGIAEGDVMISATHTHSGGPTADCLGSQSDPQYVAMLARRIALAIAEANRRKQPVELGVGVGREDSISFNRRFKMKDGTERTHPSKGDPNILSVAGPVDPDVGVLSVRTPEGRPLGVYVNFACHCTVMNLLQCSADYPHYLTETLRACLGRELVVLFGNGACGDVTQVDPLSSRPYETGEAWAQRLGKVLAGEVLKVLTALEYSPEAPLASDRRVLRLPLRRISAEEARAAERTLETVDPEREVEGVYAREVLLLEKERHRKRSDGNEVEAEVHRLEIGPAIIVGIPAEVFCQFGLDIKAASAPRPTFVVELANGCVGYLPTRQAFEGGGYEPRTARSSKLSPEAGERVVEAALTLLRG